MRRRQAFAIAAKQEASEAKSPEAFSIPQPEPIPVKQEKKRGRPRGSKSKNRL